MTTRSCLFIYAGNTFFGPNFELFVSGDASKQGPLCGYGPPESSDVYDIRCFGGVMIGQTLTIQNRYAGGVKLCDVQLLGKSFMQMIIVLFFGCYCLRTKYC